MTSVLEQKISDPNKLLAGYGSPLSDPPNSLTGGIWGKPKKHCKYCTRKIDADSNYCKYCGKSTNRLGSNLVM